MDPRLRRTEVKQAVDVARVAQRNWDLDKQIPAEDLETLIYVAQNSPKKQMETHYSLHVFTHKEKIREIYDQTKKFSVYPVTDVSPENEDDWKPPENMFADIDGNFYQDDHFSVKNSQILANAMFVYCEDKRSVRGGTHFMAKVDGASPNVKSLYEEQIDFSIGISVGILLNSAAMMGYKTGICSALEDDEIAHLLPLDPDGSMQNPKLLIGIGFENPGIDRTLHQETMNKDLPEDRRQGDDDALFKFPTFQGITDVYINGEKQ